MCDVVTSTVDPKPHKVRILWGEHPEVGQDPSEYEFATLAELNAFLLGVDEHDGWCGSRQIDPNPDGSWPAAWPGEDEEEEEESASRFRNHYMHCGQKWDDEWSCQCNDECPVCHGEIEPYKSEDLGTGEMGYHVGEDWIPEGGWPEGLLSRDD